MTNKLAKLILLAAIGLVLVACGSASDDVPSLTTTEDTQVVTPTADAADNSALSDEEKVMAFVQCMRDHGIQYKDPVVDSDGNVQRPEFVEGFTTTRAELAKPYAACSHHLEGLTLGRTRADVSKQVDELVALATCLREKGYDVDDPTAETLNQWRSDFRATFDWDDPKAKRAYEECKSTDD